MPRDPEAPAAPERSTREMDRLIRWCAAVFGISAFVLIAVTVQAVRTDSFGFYLKLAGAVYLVLSTLFLGVIASVFIKGHLGHSKEIEAPKLEIFELEDRGA